MLQNAYLLAKIDADTAENEQHFAEILPKIGNYPTARPPEPAVKHGGLNDARIERDRDAYGRTAVPSHFR